MAYTRLNPDVERVVVNAASGITRGQLYLTRVGNVVHVSGHFYNSTGIAVGAPIYETIPERLRPSLGVDIPLTIVNDGGVGGYTVFLSASGTVTQGFSGTTHSGHIAGAYLLA